MAMSEQEDAVLMKELLVECPLVDDLTCCSMIMDIFVRFMNKVGNTNKFMSHEDVLGVFLTQHYILARKRGVLDPVLAVEIAIRQMKEVIVGKVKSNER